MSGLSGGGAVDIGVARSDVSYLLIARSGGSVLRAGVAHVAGLPYGLFVLSTSHWRSMLSWAAYDGRGTRLGGGKGDPVGFR